jgi:hypothetical protein
MRNNGAVQRLQRGLGLSAIILGFALVNSTQAQEGRGELERMRIEIREMNERAGDLKAAGKHDEANELARHAKELSVRARQQAQELRKKGGRGNEVELKERIGGMKREILELRKKGHQDEAVALEDRVRRLAAEFAGRARNPEGRKKQPAPRGDEMAERHQQLEHLHQAIEHLHAAGLHEPAERLREDARNWERKLAGNEGRQVDDFNRHVEERLTKLENVIRKLSAGFEKKNERAGEKKAKK